MRIISGFLGGRSLACPQGMNTRPTSDRVKESVFSILGEKVRDAKVLDLFAGSGNLGIEALSRGASECTFVDNNRVPIEVIKKNLTSLGLNDVSTVVKSEVSAFIKRWADRGECEKFDLIFVDPPYALDLCKKVLDMIGDCGLLSRDGVVVAEYAVHFPPCEVHSCLRRMREERYGETLVGFYQTVTGV